jgi:hypothetical protein
MLWDMGIGTGGGSHWLPFSKRVLYVATGSCPESNQKFGFGGQNGTEGRRKREGQVMKNERGVHDIYMAWWTRSLFLTLLYFKKLFNTLYIYIYIYISVHIHIYISVLLSFIFYASIIVLYIELL